MNEKIKSFKRYMNESRRSSAEASVQRHWKDMDSIRDLKDKGVSASDIHAEADKHAKLILKSLRKYEINSMQIRAIKGLQNTLS